MAGSSDRFKDSMTSALVWERRQGHVIFITFEVLCTFITHEVLSTSVNLCNRSDLFEKK